MNFSTGSTTSRNHLLRAGLQGTKFSTPIMIKPEFLNLTALNHSNNHNNHSSTTNINNNNNNSTSGGPTFLTISKSRVPDIQMINKYYGLVPKKFVINSRSDFSSKPTTRLKGKQSESFDEESSESLVDENLVSKSRIRDFQDSTSNSHGGKNALRRGSSASAVPDDKTNTIDVNGLVTRKIRVEKLKKQRRIKNCGRSLSMMDNCESMGSIGVGSHSTTCKNNHHHHTNGSMTDRMDIQRVIKIDLNHMRWEESYQEKGKTDSADTGGEEEVNDETGFEIKQQPKSSNSPPSVKRGTLRKTISFDDQIMRNSSAESRKSAEKIDQKPTRRPTTALPSSATSTVQPLTSNPSPPSAPAKVTPWTSRTGQSLADRRSKFQKSFSIYQDSLDNGESDNEPEPCESSNSFLPSVKCRESKKSLHVQAPPEISTMISLISPAPSPVDDLQAEIDKVDTIINNCHNKIVQVEEKLAVDEVEQNGLSDSPTTDDTSSAQTNEKSNRSSALSEKKATTTPITPPTQPQPEPRTKKILKKAASISCENELEPKKSQVSGKSRPQTSRPKNSVSFSTSNSTRYIPPRRETFVRSATISSTKDAAGSASSPSRNLSPDNFNAGSRNRRILIKKALIEINQSSINLGKKLNARPKTAPMPDGNKKTATPVPATMPKRQPLKASTSIKVPGMIRKESTVSSTMELKQGGKEGSLEPEPEPSPPKVRVIPRKSLSMTDGFLHGFGYEVQDSEGGSGADGIDIAASLINSKKREECLKVYEKMMKKGCNVKLETIFRGLMTPSEYRMFVEAKEAAEKRALEEAEAENINPGDAGISTSQVEMLNN